MFIRFIREPLLHFFAIGALLFVLFAALNPGAMRPAEEILVDTARITSFSSQFESIWQRPPTDAELQGMIDSWVREEVLYREGIAMGLERDDQLIRRRVAQKVMFLADSLSPAEPSDDELQAWLDSDPKRYQSPATLADVRAAVERDFLNKQSSDLSEAFYQALKSRYTVRIVTESPVAAGDEAS